MKKTTSGFTIVELLIVIVVIAILATISVVAYTSIQARAADTQIKSAATQIEKAIKLWGIDNGSEIVAGYGTTSPVVDGRCSNTGTGGGALQTGNYQCALEDMLTDSGTIQPGLLSSLPPNKLWTNSNTRVLMFYSCGTVPSNNGKYALYWYLNSPSAEDTATFEQVRASCGQGVTIRDSYAMRGGVIIQL